MVAQRTAGVVTGIEVPLELVLLLCAGCGAAGVWAGQSRANRRLDPRRHAAPQPREEIGAETIERREIPVGGKHQLPSLPVEGVDGLLNLHERGSLTGKKLQVIDHEQVGIPAAAAEAGETAAVQGLEKARGELLG